ncbi:MAG TPA: 50S ribosomal protein L21 [Aestuariivirgaceae bacterium]|jgi:large subunit ribosomal protein L21|nr:50S ribosomal protein L21 [Aestuariivirgaceae bacterium]
MYAVIRTGGKQYRVAPEDVIEIERLAAKAGDQVQFSEVLMVAGEGGISFGAPLVAGATVAGEVTALTRGPKLVIFKKKRRKHFRRKNGHRQDLMEVRITEILTDGHKPEQRARPAAAAAEPAAAAAEPAALAEPAAAAKPAGAADQGAADNLSLISGVGPKIKQSLGELGYTRFAQIAALTPEEIETIETALKSKGRIARDEWIDQARELMAGNPPRAKIDRAKPPKAE